MKFDYSIELHRSCGLWNACVVFADGRKVLRGLPTKPKAELKALELVVCRIFGLDSIKEIILTKQVIRILHQEYGLAISELTKLTGKAHSSIVQILNELYE